MIMKRAFSSTVHKYYDIIIAGGGMIGSVLACKLARNPSLRGLSILLVESAPKKRWDSELIKQGDTFSNRVSALNNATKSLLQSIQVWDSICSAGCRKVTKMKIWGIGSNNISTTFSVDELPSTEALAYIVENNVLIAATMKNLEESRDNVEILHDSSISEYNLPKHPEENVVLRLKDGSSLECSLLLGSDGANSKVRQTMGVQYLTWNYKQKAIVATVKLNEETKNHTAWQKFVSSGPIALLPLSDEYSSLVWTTTPEHAKILLSLSNESFVDALNSALWQEPVNDALVTTVSNAVSSVLKTLNVTEDRREVVPPSVTDIVDSSRASFPVGFGHATCYVGHQVALVGDAAHRVHPLAGQGVNLGFGDIECLDKVLSKQISCGAKLGDIEQLRIYETMRQRCNVPKLVGIDLIQKVAGHPWSPLLAVTNAGFQIANAIPPFKKFLINTAAV